MEPTVNKTSRAIVYNFVIKKNYLKVIYMYVSSVKNQLWTLQL